MGVIVLPLAWLSAFAVFYLRSREPSAAARACGSFLHASVTCGVCLAVLTEVASAFDRVSFEWLFGAWIAFAIAFTAVAMASIRGATLPPRGSREPMLPYEVALLSSVGVILLATGLIALFAPPNNWDSMTYHMARVAHWIQNRSVRFYSTNILRQLHSNPWAEFAIMHFQILSGTDRFANCVQWLSMTGCVLSVPVIAGRLGAGRRGRILASVAAATMPMGILQASNTQNDYVVGFWLVCLVYYVLLLREKHCLYNMIGLGCSLGLAVLTKGTAYVFAFPFVLWLLLSQWRQVRRRAVLTGLIVAVIVVLINAGHYGRNLHLYGDPLGPGANSRSWGEEGVIVNTSHRPLLMLSNIIRNAGLHMETPVDEVNAAMEAGIRRLHAILGVDINDPSTTHAGEFHVRGLSRGEDGAGNGLHLVLIIVSLGISLFSRRIFRTEGIGGYALCLISGFVLFCVYLRWQPWGSRLQLPLFVLSAPLIGTVIDSTIRRERVKTVMVLAIVLILAAIPWLFNNRSRPLAKTRNVLNIERIEQYFANRPRLRAPYEAAVAFLETLPGCRSVGLVSSEDGWEYPFWVLFKNGGGNIRIEHVNVKNVSRARRDVNFKPDAVLSLLPPTVDGLSIDGVCYRKSWSSVPVTVFLPDASRSGICSTSR